MTAPLTPKGCDLRGLPFMALDVDRVLESDTLALATGEEFKAAFTLWCRSWKQTPAASLPDNEIALARFAGYALSDWRQISEGALRGWVKCDDGRLYHPVVAEKALRAWIERIGFKDRSARASAGRYDTFVYQADTFAAMRREAVICLERLAPGSALGLGVVLQANETAASSSGPAPSRTASRTDLGCEGIEKGEVSDSERDRERNISPAAGASEARQAFDLYNEVARDIGLSTARTLDDAREKKIRAALKSHGLDGWREALDQLRQSRFCQGENDRGWKATLDFLLRPAKLTLLREGGYAHGGPKGGPAPSRGYLDVALGEVMQ